MRCSWYCMNNARIKYMVPREGIEPPTRRSSGVCSTTELPRRFLSFLCHLFVFFEATGHFLSFSRQEK